MKGLYDEFYVFEGIDRIGKTTVAEEVCAKLKFKYMKFPNESLTTGKVIRKILQGIIPYEPYSFQGLNALDKYLTPIFGKVICDRYSLSQTIYGLNDGLPKEYLDEICKKLPTPDATFIFTGFPFCEDTEIFSETTTKIAELYEDYLYKNRFNERVIRIEANKDIKDTIQEILEYIWYFEK